MHIGIITYDYYHLKTEQIVHKLLFNHGYAPNNLSLIALPFEARKKRAPLIHHRPAQASAVSTEELAIANRIKFHRNPGDSPLLECDYYLITGASILPGELIAGKKVINAHPGLIPAARGLDAFKWSIINKLPLGVTLHYIDEQVDSGEIITMEKTPIYSNDTLESLARRHYELEIDMLANFEFHMQAQKKIQVQQQKANRRMPPQAEEQLIKMFESYVQYFRVRTQNSPPTSAS